MMTNVMKQGINLESIGRGSIRLLFMFLKRPVVFFIAMYWLSNMLIDYEKIRSGIETRVIGSLSPTSFEYLAQIRQNEGPIDQKRLKEYVYFYSQMTEYFPGQADSYQLLGFCYYYLGDQKRAVSFYKKAIGLNPNFFWSYYNLSIIYFENRRYQEAARLLEKATALSPQATLDAVRLSPIVYRMILKNISNADIILQKSLHEGYLQSKQLLGLCRDYLKNLSPQGTPRKFLPQIF